MSAQPAKEMTEYHFILTTINGSLQRTESGYIMVEDGAPTDKIYDKCVNAAGPHHLGGVILYWSLIPSPKGKEAEEYAFVLTYKVDGQEITIRRTTMLQPQTTRYQALAGLMTGLGLDESTPIIYWNLEKNKL